MGSSINKDKGNVFEFEIAGVRDNRVRDSEVKLYLKTKQSRVPSIYLVSRCFSMFIYLVSIDVLVCSMAVSIKFYESCSILARTCKGGTKYK